MRVQRVAHKILHASSSVEFYRMTSEVALGAGAICLAASLHEYRPGVQVVVVNIDHRDSRRIIFDDQNVTDWVLERLRLHVS